MTGQLVGSAGLVTAPGYTFSGAPKTGFFLAGANQIGWAANGVQGATFNADTSITFAGTISAAKGTIPVGAVMDYAGGAASIPLPPGWLLCFGQQVSTTTYAALFAVLGNLYGAGVGTFGIPDYRGRATYGQDNMGGSAANRITIAGLNFDGTILGNVGGNQNHTLTTAELAAHNHGITDPGHNHTTSTPVPGGGSSFETWNTSSLATGATLGGPNTGSSTTGITINNAGSGNAHTILSPAIITNKIIFAGV
jgi:microcystin-dependent protein